MRTSLNVIWHGLRDAFLMAWEVWWALVLGFAISAIVQAWVPRERVERALSGGGPKSIGWATGLGAASSSCSYAAVAIGKSLFQKGAQRGERARVPVRLDQPRVGARARAVGADRLAVHGRRVPRRDRDDRPDDGAAAAVRQPAARGAGPRARAAGGQRPPAPQRQRARCSWRRAADLSSTRGPTSLTTSAATGRCCGRRSRSGSCSPGSSPSSATASSRACSSSTLRSRCRRSRTCSSDR